MRTIAAAAASDADRFGDLTDDLLRHVMSFLPSDDALQSCVLDTRWHDSRGTSQACTSMLATASGSGAPLVKCKIITYPDDYPVYGKWIYTNTKLLVEFVLECQARELILTTVRFHALDPPVFDVPFISHHLKTINLHLVNLECSALNLSGCPILEELKMQRCNIHERKISSKSLKHLCISDSCMIPVDFRVWIFPPDLISLRVDDFNGATPFLEDMPFLVTAYVGLGYSCYDLCYGVQRGCDFHCGCTDYPTKGGCASQWFFIYRWDLEWCPIFSKLKTLLLNEWFTAIDLSCILQHSPMRCSLFSFVTRSLTRATARQETIDQSFVCAHLKVVNIECGEVHEEIYKIVNILRTYGILRDHISIKAPSSPSYCFSFQKDPQVLLPPPAAPGPAASTTADGN
ncbi:hypothetical protein ZWY2020_023344 [Hordeum vulgare]|nr:hypothetical protein ZWY2020_023344 [Hordeum vulgare]